MILTILLQLPNLPKAPAEVLEAPPDQEEMQCKDLQQEGGKEMTEKPVCFSSSALEHEP